MWKAECLTFGYNRERALKCTYYIYERDVWQKVVLVEYLEYIYIYIYIYQEF